MIEFDITKKPERVLNAALMCFKHYGFKRTSMDDIAKAAEMSRPALYILFKNKTDIFCSLATHFHDTILAQVREVLSSPADLKTRITQAILVRNLPMYMFAHGSLHGPELLDANVSIAGDINTNANTAYFDMLKHVVQTAITNGEVQTKPHSMCSTDITHILCGSATGLKSTAESLEHYETLLTYMVTTLIDGLTIPHIAPSQEKT